MTSPEPTPLTEQQQQDYQRTIEQDREQREAAKNSKITRIAGWWVIAGFLFEMATATLDNHVKIGGVIYLIAGILILRGSQAALRFVIVLSSFTLLLGVGTIFWNLTLQQPLLAGTRWFSPDQPGYWGYEVLPSVVVALQLRTGLRALHDRGLPLWTNAVKNGCFVLGIVSVINLGIYLNAWNRNRQLGTGAKAEIDLVRSYYQNEGDWQQDLKRREQFKAFPRILEATSRSSTQGSTTAYSSDRFKGDWKQLPKYEESLRKPSGKWTKWEVILANP